MGPFRDSEATSWMYRLNPPLIGPYHNINQLYDISTKKILNRKNNINFDHLLGEDLNVHEH